MAPPAGNTSSPLGGTGSQFQSTPLGNSNSSQTPRRSRRSIHTSSPASSPLPLETPPSHMAGLASTPSTTTRRRGPRHNPSATPSTPLSTDDMVPPYSSDRDDNDNMETDGQDQDDTTPVFVWGTNISVQEVNGAILRFLRHFRDTRSASESTDAADLMSEGKYMRIVHRIMELEGAESTQSVHKSAILGFPNPIKCNISLFEYE